MSGAYDQLRKHEYIEAPETVNTDWYSPTISLDDRVGAFSISLKYVNGTSVDMKVFVAISNTGEEGTYGNIAESLVQITADSGTILFDSIDSGAAFCKIFIQVTGGSIDVTSVYFNGTQFH